MWLECIPNVSEGRSAQIIKELEEEIASVPEVLLLDTHKDPDHNRSVFTFAGSPAATVESAFKLTAKVKERLDITKHGGVHPRMGLVDVCPFVPLGSTPMEKAVEAARSLGKRVGEELSVPVFLYGEAALNPQRISLPEVRISSLQRLRREIKENRERQPDFGPAELAPGFGAMAVGARKPLVAFNVDLHTNDLQAVRLIASKLREKEGGLAHLRALGFFLESRKKAQASFNLLDSEAVPPAAVFEEVKKLSSQRGIEIDGSELVGLIPRKSVYKSFARSLSLPSFGAGKVLEDRLAHFLPLLSHVDRIADPKSGIGGGTVAAEAGGLAAGLLAFAASIVEKGKSSAFFEFQQKAASFLCSARSDREAYANWRKASKAPPGEEREEAVRKALKEACRVPVKVMETSLETLSMLESLRGRGAILSDIKVAAHLLLAATKSAGEILELNLQNKHASCFAEDFRATAEKLLRSVQKKVESVLAGG